MAGWSEYDPGPDILGAFAANDFDLLVVPSYYLVFHGKVDTHDFREGIGAFIGSGTWWGQHLQRGVKAGFYAMPISPFTPTRRTTARLLSDGPERKRWLGVVVARDATDRDLRFVRGIKELRAWTDNVSDVKRALVSIRGTGSTEILRLHLDRMLDARFHVVLGGA